MDWHKARTLGIAGGLGLLAFCVLPIACRRGAPMPPATTQPAGGPVERKAERGPVKLRVRLDRDRVTIAEPIELTIEAEAERDVDVRLPKFGSPIPDFTVRDFRETVPKAGVRPRVWRQAYTLDSFVSGDFEVPGVEVRFSDRRPRGPATTQAAIASRVRTEPLTLHVESLLAGQFDPAKFNDIKGPTTLPLPRSYKLALWTGAVAAALAATGAIVWWVRRRRAVRAGVRMPPHQWALLELERLVAEDLVGRGRITEFYYRLNGLLRQYIELRFGLAAAEQTSEEFIRALQTDPQMPAEHRGTLRDFVAACDPVKYARYRPGAEEIEVVFNAARDFILGTQQREREIELEPAGAAA